MYLWLQACYNNFLLAFKPAFYLVNDTMFEAVVAWFSNFNNVLGLLLIVGSIAILLLTMKIVGKDM
jgi:hypothetical protein